MPEPKEVVQRWVEAFNRRDVEGLAALYAEDAVNHQVTQDPVAGRAAIRAMFEREFAAAEMQCQVENLFQDGDWAILEWKDPKGLRGCGFFRVAGGKIRFQRGYWDQLSFLRQQRLPMPSATGPATAGDKSSTSAGATASAATERGEDRRRYMVIERYRSGAASKVYARLRERGRLTPVGLQYVASWVDVEFRRCYQLMETHDPALLEEWMEPWRDLVEFAVHEVIDSDEAATRIREHP